jgi:hypothetical protein
MYDRRRNNRRPYNPYWSVYHYPTYYNMPYSNQIINSQVSNVNQSLVNFGTMTGSAGQQSSVVYGRW